MASSQCLAEDLNIPLWAINHVVKESLNCVVPCEWFNNVHQRWIEQHLSALPIDDSAYNSLGHSDAKLMLSPSCAQCISGWQRSCVTVIEKDDAKVLSLVDTPLCSQSEQIPSNAEVRSIISTKRQQCLLMDAFKKYHKAVQLTVSSNKSSASHVCDFNSFVKNMLFKLYGFHPIHLSTSSETLDSKCEPVRHEWHSGVMSPDFVIESSHAFYVFLPFVRYSLDDLVTFSPGRLTHTGKLFILYQLLHIVRHFHKLGMSIGDLHLNEIAVDDRLWITIPPPRISGLCRKLHRHNNGDVANVNLDTKSVDNSTFVFPLCGDVSMGCKVHQLNYSNYTQIDLPEIVHRWVYGEISNFDYLMLLNRFVGRSTEDPNHYPILPWVMDFSVANGGYRDLTKTKYRLNKGDEQLDLTYEMATNELPATPFHVSDFLSDITYYVYMARRTNKSVLCRLVRHRWVPEHYPASLERLYHWTPDECIPEFYTDPDVFVSMHDDLPDLELPSWARDANDFIRIHREVLEGSYVSTHLHHWIDLTFGYKLTGPAAVSSKNVCLQLVDNHHQLLNHGVVQLFTHPHPARHSNVKPDTCSPLSALESLEAVQEFCINVLHSLPVERPAVKTDLASDMSEIRRQMTARDMQVIGCLTTELFLAQSCWSHSNSNTLPDTDSDLLKRYQLIRSILSHCEHLLSRSVRQGIAYLLNLCSQWSADEVDKETGSVFSYPSLGIDDLPPPDIDILLHPSVRVFFFPEYFQSLHRYLLKYNDLCAEIGLNDNDLLRIANDKVSVLAQYLTRMSSRLGQEGLQLIIPYIQHLFMDLHMSAIQSAWLLFHPISQAIGPTHTAKHFLHLLTSLFDTDETSVKYLKIYHRSFIIQLIVRLGLETFLTTFSTRLVEAAAGYKDFRSCDAVGSDDIGQFSNSYNIVNVPESYIDSETMPSDVVFENDDTDTGCLLDLSAEDEDTVSGLSSELDVDGPDICSEARSLHSVQSEPCRLSTDNTFMDEVSDHSQSVLVVDLCDGEATVRSVVTGETGAPYRSMSQHSSLMSKSVPCNECNISNFAADTLKWLSERLGPVLTAKYISRNLLRMLSLCYLGEDQLQFTQETQSDVLSLTRRPVVGDRHAVQILDCLTHISALYGQQFILLQYLQHVTDLVQSSASIDAVTLRGEAGIIGSMALLVATIPNMTDKILLDVLQVPLLTEILLPVLRLVTSPDLSYPSGSLSRRIIVYKLLDTLYIVSRRIGFDRTRQDLTESLQIFFHVFDIVHAGYNSSSEVDENKANEMQSDGPEQDEVPGVLYEVRHVGESCKVDVDIKPTHKRQSSLSAFKQHSLSPTQPDDVTCVDGMQICQDKNSIRKELSETFTPELAYTAYIAFCRVAGSIHMAEKLSNDDLMRHLCAEYELTTTAAAGGADRSSTSDNGLGDSAYIEGNKIVIRQQPTSSVVSGPHTKLFSTEMGVSSQRHLRGNWLAYWEHEVGRSDRDTAFQFQQISLQKFTGHTAAVRSICVLDNENSFVSASKDRTVRLWSLRNCSDGSASVGCQWIYAQHKKPVLGLGFIESVSLMASTDGNLHIWDPFAPCGVRQVNMSKVVNGGNAAGTCVSHVLPLPAPSHSLITATTGDNYLRLVDVRTGKVTNEMRSTPLPSGAIHCLSISPDGHIVTVGYSTGLLSTLDIRTGLLLASWKAHESDILDVKAIDARRIVTSSLDQTIAVWRNEDGRQLASLKGCNEAVHFMSIYREMLISASTTNKINIHSSFETMAELTSTKLKNDVVRGTLSGMAVLPLNRLLLLGTDSGIINLLA